VYEKMFAILILDGRSFTSCPEMLTKSCLFIELLSIIYSRKKMALILDGFYSVFTGKNRYNFSIANSSPMQLFIPVKPTKNTLV
jgi:hypothetical protein